MHRCISVEKENQLDATEWFIALIICSTCFGHLYAHHQELEIVLVLLPHILCNALVAGGRLSGAGQQDMPADLLYSLLVFLMRTTSFTHTVLHCFDNSNNVLLIVAVCMSDCVHFPAFCYRLSLVLRNFPQHPPFQDTLNLCYFLDVRDQV